MRSRAEIRQAAAQGDAAAQFQVQLAQGYVDYQDYEEFVGNYYLEIGRYQDPGEILEGRRRGSVDAVLHHALVAS